MLFRCGYRISIRGFVRPSVGLLVGPLVRWSVGPLVRRSVSPLVRWSIGNASVSAGRDEPANDLLRVYELVDCD